ncbi:hypothetical protein [Sorangium sp. So ce1153]|uniref:hypothetical protein n=1 Tax=Sorangium sp. So ce1153 TaxID=3133333 RepID=UPI003F5EFCA1
MNPQTGGRAQQNGARGPIGGRIYGGTAEEIVVLADAGETAEIYDPASDAWTLTASTSFRHT